MRVAFFAVGLSIAFAALPASAQTPPAEPVVDVDALAKETQNPISSLISFPLQFNFNSGGDLENRSHFDLKLQPVIPFKASTNWNVIARTIVPIESFPGPEGVRYSGIGDIEMQIFLSPAKAGSIVWGVGPIDVVAAQVTIRPELQALVDFTNPTRTNVSEIVVTAPGAPPIASVDDLAGKEVFARKDSKYYQSLVALNERLKAQGKPPVVIRDVPGTLEDDDLLEMVNAGLIPAIVVDNYLAEFWKKVFTNITVHDKVALRTDANLALAVRKNSPQLMAELNAFLKNFGLGTAVGNVVEKRYLVNTTYAKNAASEAEQQKFVALIDLFRKYSQQYDVDYLLMAAQGFQESQLNQNAKSQVGAIGVMQVMPATGGDMKVGDITQVDANIHAGVKYFRFMMDRYFKDEPMDRVNKGLFTFASYNAGPARIRQLRREAEKRGLDPNVWFGNVEQIASERIGRETVTYVANIYKYYIAYRLIVDERERRAEAKATLKANTK
jgi:membrane-bound lytic murein transglycosylase MltF